jgi:hypothetical protein
MSFIVLDQVSFIIRQCNSGVPISLVAVIVHILFTRFIFIQALIARLNLAIFFGPHTGQEYVLQPN